MLASVGSYGGRRRPSFYDAIKGAGGLPGLEFCVDQTDINSWAGTGQQLLDVSGKTAGFNLGTTSGVDAADPVSFGLVGSRSPRTRLSVLSGSFNFSYATANSAFIESIHKAGAVYTIVSYGNGSNIICGTVPAGTNNGFSMGMYPYPQMGLRVTGAAGAMYSVDSNNPKWVSANFSQNYWHFAAVAIDVPNARGIFHTDDLQEPLAPVYAAPSAVADPQLMCLASSGPLNNLLTSGSVCGCLAMWSRALSAQELWRIYRILNKVYAFGTPNLAIG